MYIVHVGPASDVPILSRFGGALQRRVWEMARTQVGRGHRVAVYSFGEHARETIVDGVELRFLRCFTPHPIRQLEFLARCVADVRRRHQRVDVLHFHGKPEGAALSRGLARATALSYDYFIFRRGRSMPWGRVYRRMLMQFDHLLPCSEYCKNESSRYWDIDPARMDVLYNGVNLEQFRPDSDEADAQRRSIGASGPFLLYVGRVCEQKGSHVLLRAVRLLRERHPAVHLVVAGPIGQFGNNAPDPLDWRSRIRDVGGVYLGAVDESRLRGLYSAATALVMPTIEFEMFGMAAVEAQACGTPVIASDHGGLRETVPLDSGLRFETGNPEALAGCADSLLRDDTLRTRLAKAAVRNAERFSWRSVCDAFDSLVQRDGVSA